MHNILALIEKIAVGGLVSSKVNELGNKSKRAGLLALCGFVGLVGFFICVFALYSYLLLHLAAWQSAMAVGALLLAAALITLLVIRSQRRQPEPQGLSQEELVELVTMIAETGIDDVKSQIGDNPKTSMALACAVGVLLGRKLNL